MLGKSRAYQHVALPERVCTALERYERITESPANDAFVFPIEHAPSKYAAIRNQLEDADELLEETDVDELIRGCEIMVPSISTAGPRSLMQRLCEEAGLEIDGEYLKPHGGRRELGMSFTRRAMPSSHRPRFVTPQLRQPTKRTLIFKPKKQRRE